MVRKKCRPQSECAVNVHRPHHHGYLGWWQCPSGWNRLSPSPDRTPASWLRAAGAWVLELSPASSLSSRLLRHASYWVVYLHHVVIRSQCPDVGLRAESRPHLGPMNSCSFSPLTDIYHHQLISLVFYPTDFLWFFFWFCSGSMCPAPGLSHFDSDCLELGSSLFEGRCSLFREAFRLHWGYKLTHYLGHFWAIVLSSP